MRRISIVLASALLLAGCGSVLDAARGNPDATPTDFAGLVRAFGEQNLAVSSVVSGDPGCTDRHLAPMAISFHISSGAETLPLSARAYRFKDDATYARLRESLDRCASQWISDPAKALIVDAAPYVLFVDGVSDEGFKEAARTALSEAAGE